MSPLNLLGLFSLDVQSPASKMISDDDLYRLAFLLGSAAMLLIVLYHFLEVNAVDETVDENGKATLAQKDTKTGSIGR